jgi:hypothetical protein
MCFISMQIIAWPNQIGKDDYKDWVQERGPSL